MNPRCRPAFSARFRSLLTLLALLLSLRPATAMAQVAEAGPVVRAVQVDQAGPAGRAAQEGEEDEGRLDHFVDDLWHGIEVFAEDSWDVVTFPTWMDRQGWVETATVLGTTAVMMGGDREMFDRLQDQKGKDFWDPIHEAGEFFEPMGLQSKWNKWYAAGMAVGYFSGWDPLLHVSSDILRAHLIAAATYIPPRAVIGRERPRAGVEEFTFADGRSLPSGHASTVMHVAAVLSHHVGWWPASVAFYGAAGTVLLQRVESGAHWPSDTFLGAAWGWGVARVVLRNAEARRSGDPDDPGADFSERDERRVRITPYRAPGGGMGVSVSIPLGGGF